MKFFPAFYRKEMKDERCMAKKEILGIQDGSIQLDDKMVIEDASISLIQGEKIGLCSIDSIERRGFAQAIAGMVAFEKGQVLIDGVNVENYCIGNAQKFGVFYVSEQSKLIANLSVLDNLFSLVPRFGLKIVRHSNKEKTLDYLLDTLGMDISVRAKIYQLYPAEIYLLEIIKAVLQGARIILLDNLQRFCNAKLSEKVQRIARLYPEITFVYVADYTDSVLRQMDRIITLRNHRVSGWLLKQDYSRSKLWAMCGGGYASDKLENEEIPLAGEILFELGNLEQQGNGLDIEVHENEIVGIYVETEQDIRELQRRLYTNQLYNYRIRGKSVRTYQRAAQNGVFAISPEILDQAEYKCFSDMENVTLLSMKLIARGTVINSRMEKFLYQESTKSRYGAMHQDNERWQSFSELIYRMTASSKTMLIFDRIIPCFDSVCRNDVLCIISQCRAKNRGILFISTNLKECYMLCDRFYVPFRYKPYSRKDIPFDLLCQKLFGRG